MGLTSPTDGTTNGTVGAPLGSPSPDGLCGGPALLEGRKSVPVVPHALPSSDELRTRAPRRTPLPPAPWPPAEYAWDPEHPEDPTPAGVAAERAAAEEAARLAEEAHPRKTRRAARQPPVSVIRSVPTLQAKR